MLQVSSLKTWLQSEAETRKLPDLWRTTRAKASALWATAKTEIASFDEAAGLSQRAYADRSTPITLVPYNPIES